MKEISPKKFFLLLSVFPLLLTGCAVKRISQKGILPEKISAKQQFPTPEVSVSFIYIPRDAASFDKFRQFAQKENIKYCCAVSESFAVAPEDKNILAMVKTLVADKKIQLFMRLRTDPVLPLLADNSTYLKPAAGGSDIKKSRFQWPEDIRNQLALEKESLRARYQQPMTGFVPFAGLVDKTVLKNLLGEKFEYIVTGPYAEPWSTIGSMKDSHILQTSANINALLYGDKSLQAEEKAARVSELIKPSNDYYAIVLDETVFTLSAEQDFTRFLSALLVKLREARISVVLPEEYVAAHLQSISAAPMPDQAASAWTLLNLSSWIGDEEKDIAWVMLAHARSAVDRYKDSGRADIRRLDSATQEIYTAEAGSNFYYLGAYPDAQKKQETDKMFRAGLLNIYRLIGESPPEELYQPISLLKVQSEAQRARSGNREQGENYVFWQDPAGDDAGAGTLSYPTIPLFAGATGFADLLGFGFQVDQNTINLKVTLGNAGNYLNAPNGISFPLIDVYIDLNHRANAGSSNALAGRDVCFTDSDGWEYAVVVTPWNAGLYRSAGNDTVIKVISLSCVMDADGKTLVIRVPRTILRGNPFNWGYAVLSMGYAGWIAREPAEPMGVTPQPTEKSLGGRLEGTQIVPVLDIIDPADGQEQKDILTPNETTGAATVPCVRLQ